MANILSIISSFLLIMQTNNGILARIEFMVVLNSILLLILFIFDTYRRRSRSKLVKYILLVVDAASNSMVIHTLGLMQSAPIINNLFEVWAILLVALRFGSNYIAVYGLQDQRLHWSMELGQAVASYTWAANLNGTRNSDFSIPLWVLWALQPSRIGYMYYAYEMACRSYRQGLSSVFIADYMENENEQTEHEASSDINRNDSTNHSEYKPRGTNPNDDCGVGPRSDSRVSNRRGKPEDMVDLTNAKKVNLRTKSRSLKEMEEVSQNTDYQEPRNYNPNAEPQWRVTEADGRTNVEVPSSSGVYDQSSLKRYPNLIQGKTSRSVNEIEEVSEETNYQEPSSCYPNTEPQSSIGEANARTNVEVPISSEAYDPSSMRGYQYIIQGETWQEVEAEMVELEDKLQLTVTRKEKLITLEKIWNCKGKLMGEWGDKDGQLKDLCLSYALYRLLRCRFDDFPLPDNSIPKTRTLLVSNILSRTKNHDSIKKGNKGPEELQEGTKEENESTEEQQEGTKEGNKNPNGQGNDNNQHGVVWYLLKLYSIISIMKRALCFIFKKEKQQDGSNAEKNEDEVTEEVADRVFEITGTELSFLNDYMYSRFPVIFWRTRGLIFSIMFYITIIASTCWVAISVVNVYTPHVYEFSHEINGTNIDVLITWSMLLFIVVKETWEILIYLFSDWTKVMLISMYVERTCTRNWLMENFIWLLCKYSVVRKWHGKIDQYNFLEAYDYKPGVCNLAYYLSLGSLPKATHGVESKSLIVLPKEVKKAIVKSISSLLKEEHKKGSLPGGMPSILSRNNVNIAATSQISELQGLHTSFVKREQELHTCSHIILVWHIATSLCEIELCRHYNIYLADSELPSLWSSLNCCSSEPFLVKLERLGKDLSKNFIVANSLSRYCASLLIKQPNLLADNMFTAEEIFQHAVHEARNTLEGCDTLQSIYKRLMEEGGKEIRSKKENTIMRRSARLGKILIETLDEAARWKALAGVWADLLVYMAPNSNVEAHEESLATGGELITHVWILLYHAGILKNSLVDQGDDNDAETPDSILENSPENHGEENDVEESSHVGVVYHNDAEENGLIDQGDDNDAETPDSILENSPENHGEENDVEESSLVRVVYQNGVEENGLIDQGRAKAGTSIQDGASSPKDRWWSEIDFNKMGPHFKYLHDQTIQRVPQFEFFTIPIPTNLFHHKERNIMIHIQDIDDLLTNKWLNVTIIQIYMLHMYRYCINYGITSVGFMDPNKVNESFLETHKTESIEYMCHAMQAQQEKKLILAPYYQMKHWILLVIMPGADTVYVLDSNPPQPKYLIEDPFNVAFFKYRGSNVSFKQFKCPRQPESWECGYYVMNFMHDIIMANLDLFPDAEDVFAADKYMRRDIDNIRNQWGEILRDEWAQVQNNLAET